MPDISDIVNIQISLSASTITKQGFGTLLIVGDSDILPSRDTVVLSFDATLVASNNFACDINGNSISEDWDTDNDTTMGNIATAIAALADVTSCVASDVGSVGYDNTLTIVGVADTDVIVTDAVVTGGASQAGVTVTRTPWARIRTYDNMTAVAVDFAATDPEYKAANAAFSQDNVPEQIAIGRKNSSGETWVEALNAIVNSSDDWYGLACTTRTKADVEAIAAWAESRMKLFGTSSDDANILTTGTTDIAASLNSSAYDRSFCLYHQESDKSANDQWPECAWFGDMLPIIPGSQTWKFKTLSGITVSSLTSAQITNAKSKKCNYYAQYGGVNMTAEGYVASGEWIDTMRGIDWLKVELETNIFGILAGSGKVPYTDAGIGRIENQIRLSLDTGIVNDFLTDNPAYEITVPKRSSISAAQRSTRELTGITFTAHLSNAIHKVTVNGTVVE